MQDKSLDFIYDDVLGCLMEIAFSDRASVFEKKINESEIGQDDFLFNLTKLKEKKLGDFYSIKKIHVPWNTSSLKKRIEELQLIADLKPAEIEKVSEIVLSLEEVEKRMGAGDYTKSFMDKKKLYRKRTYYKVESSAIQKKKLANFLSKYISCYENRDLVSADILKKPDIYTQPIDLYLNSKKTLNNYDLTKVPVKGKFDDFFAHSILLMDYRKEIKILSFRLKEKTDAVGVGKSRTVWTSAQGSMKEDYFWEAVVNNFLVPASSKRKAGLKVPVDYFYNGKTWFLTIHDQKLLSSDGNPHWKKFLIVLVDNFSKEVEYEVFNNRESLSKSQVQAAFTSLRNRKEWTKLDKLIKISGIGSSKKNGGYKLNLK